MAVGVIQERHRAHGCTSSVGRAPRRAPLIIAHKHTHLLDMQVIVRLLDTNERLDYLHDQALCEPLAAR
jgi:hypothetical protein